MLGINGVVKIKQFLVVIMNLWLQKYTQLLEINAVVPAVKAGQAFPSLTD